MKYTRTIAIVLVVAMIAPMTAFGQMASPAASYNQGVLDAETQHSSFGWGFAGFLSGTLFSWLGTGVTVVVAAVSSPSPRFVPDDADHGSYREGYRDEAKRRNVRSAAIPGVIMSTLWTVLILGSL